MGGITVFRLNSPNTMVVLLPNQNDPKQIKYQKLRKLGKIFKSGYEYI
jgi:hypothetical protein